MTPEKVQQIPIWPENEFAPPNVETTDAQKPLEPQDKLISRTIPLELARASASEKSASESMPPLPARWEDVTIEARNRNVFSSVVEKLRDVPAHKQLAKLITLSGNEGYVWVVYGNSGSGKSAFFQTLEYKFRATVKAFIINANDHDLSNSADFAKYLTAKITDHVNRFGTSVPLIMVLEGREQAMTPEERSSISQALRNVLRSPGPGRNVIFVLPINNLNQANLFIQQAQETGVAVSKDGVYTFVGPSYTEHAEIVSDLFAVLNGRSIEEYGIMHSDLQNLASAQQTIGEYIRTIRDELSERNDAYQSIVSSYGYRPLTVIVCFVSPEPAYVTQRVIKGMATGPFGHINPAEVLRVTKGNRARKWDNRGHVLAQIIHYLDIRVVEFPPDIITKLFYAWGWGEGGYSGRKRIASAIDYLEQGLEKENVRFNRPPSVRQNVRQQLSASNLFRLIAGEETRRIDGTRLGHLPEESAPQSELQRRSRENAAVTVVKIACDMAGNYQYELHGMIAQGLEDALRQGSAMYPKISSLKGVYPESYLSFLDKYNREQKHVRPDIIVETQERLYLLEFYWRNKQLSDAEIASYVLKKIEESYLMLPMIKALEDIP